MTGKSLHARLNSFHRRKFWRSLIVRKRDGEGKSLTRGVRGATQLKCDAVADGRMRTLTSLHHIR